MSRAKKQNVCEDVLFQELFKTHSRDLYKFLYYKYGEENNPQDLVQEAFIKLWNNCNKVPPEKARSFLFTVANNQMLIEGLSEPQRIAFLLNRIEGKKHEEIAEMLGISRKAVEKRIYAALATLREKIGEI